MRRVGRSEQIPSGEHRAHGPKYYQRVVAGMTALATVASIVGLDAASNPMLTSTTHLISEQGPINPERSLPFERTAPATTFVFPGYNAYADAIDNVVKPILGEYGPITLVQYGSDFEPDQVADQIADQLHSINPDSDQKIVLYGHSMGGVFALEAAANLINRHDVDASRLIIMLDCTPPDAAAVAGGNQAMIKVLASLYNIDNGGILSRDVAETIDAWSQQDSFLHGIELGFQRANPPSQEKENSTLIDLAHVFMQRDQLWQAIATLNQHHVTVSFTAPAHNDGTEATGYDNDGMVKDETAFYTWDRYFREILSYTTPVDLHGIQTANRGAYEIDIKAMLRAIGIAPARRQPGTEQWTTRPDQRSQSIDGVTINPWRSSHADADQINTIDSTN